MKRYASKIVESRIQAQWPSKIGFLFLLVPELSLDSPSINLPLIWSKVSSLRDNLIRTSFPITALLIHFSTPPLEAVHQSWIHKSKEYNHQSKRQARVQRRTQSHCVLCPPPSRPVLDRIVEDVTHYGPHREVEPSRWWYPAETSEKDWQVDLSHNVLLFVASVKPEDDRSNSSEWKAPYESTIGSIWPKELLRAHHSPKDAAIEVNTSDGADESIGCFWRANIRDMGEHPVEHTDLGDGRHNCGDHLNGEENSRRDLHVVTEF